MAEKLTMGFTGDSSFFAFNGEDGEVEEEDPEAPPVERFRELHRISHTVRVSAAVAFSADSGLSAS